MLQDHPERCSGCQACRLACAMRNHGQVNPALAALGLVALFPDPGRFQIDICNQCGACAEVCPVQAITDVDGIYRLDPKICSGCHQCIEACPRGVIFTHPTVAAPIKCTDCGECAAFCPREALTWERSSPSA